jgi:phosphatidylglycerophosphate synthase
MLGKRVSRADVLESYTPEKRWTELEGDFPSFVLYRPLSFLLTPMAVALGVSPMFVTLTSAGIALCMPVIASRGGAHAYLWVAALAFLAHVLDCLDGNIARTTKRASKLGELTDGFVDACFWTLYLASIGLLVDRGPQLAGHGLELALSSALLVILHRHLRESYASSFGERAEFTTVAPARLGMLAIVRIVVISFERLYVFALLAGGAVGRLDLVLLCIAGYVAAIFVGALAVTFGAALRKPR